MALQNPPIIGKFLVLFIGEVRNGIDSDQLKDSMANMFNTSRSRIDRIFTGRPEVVRTDIDEETAQQYRNAIRDAGGVTWYEPMPPFYRKYVDRRKNNRTRRSPKKSSERRVNSRPPKADKERRERSGRRYHDR